MLKKSIICFLICCAGSEARAFHSDSTDTQQAIEASVQRQDTARHAVMVEFGGSLLIGSLAWETFTPNREVNFHIGLLYIPTVDSYFGANVSVSCFLFSGDHRAEIGGGWSGLISNSRSFGSALDLALRLGYRYQPVHGGYNFGITFTPLFSLFSGRIPIFPWGGISIGWGY